MPDSEEEDDKQSAICDSLGAMDQMGVIESQGHLIEEIKRRALPTIHEVATRMEGRIRNAIGRAAKARKRAHSFPAPRCDGDTGGSTTTARRAAWRPCLVLFTRGFIIVATLGFSREECVGPRF